MWHLSCIYYCCNVHAWFFMMLIHCIHMYLACFLQCLHAFMQLIPGYAHLHNSSFAVLQLHTYILSEITLSHIWAAFWSHNVEAYGIFCNCLTRKPASLHLTTFCMNWCLTLCGLCFCDYYMCGIYVTLFRGAPEQKRWNLQNWLIDRQPNYSARHLRVNWVWIGSI